MTGDGEMFQPKVGLQLHIGEETYTVQPHPSAPKIPYGQEGKQAVVFKVKDSSGTDFALKVFKPRFRQPYLVSVTERMERYADLPGMKVCRRRIINPVEHKEILREHPDLSYAAIMPWIDGPTWSEFLLSRRTLKEGDCLQIAKDLLKILLSLEEKGVSHGDLSGVNVILPYLAGGEGIFLVDVEQMYIPGAERPEMLPGGSPGYALPTSGHSYWGPLADRYSGSILLGEILAACDKEVLKVSWGESYFQPEELGTDSPKFRLMESVIARVYGDKLAAVFRRNWFAKDLESCSTFAEWYIYLPEKVKVDSDEKALETGKKATSARLPRQEWDLDGLLGRAHELFANGDFRGTVELYQYILNVYSLPDDFRDHLKREIDICKEKVSKLEMPRQAEREPQFAEPTYPATAMGYEMRLEAPVVEKEDAQTQIETKPVSPLAEDEPKDLTTTPDFVEESSSSALTPDFLIDFPRKRHDFGRLAVLIGVPLVLVVAVISIILLTRGGSAVKIKVPDLKGMSLEEAENELDALGLRIGETTYQETGEAVPGTVISTFPSPGGEVDEGGAVNLSIAAAPQRQASTDTTESTDTGGRVTCPTCFGRGYITCPKCHGQVYLPGGGICDLCHGKREIVCPTCGGTGYVNK